MVMLMHEHTRSSSTRTQAAAREAVVSRWASCLRQPCAGFFHEWNIARTFRCVACRPRPFLVCS